MLLSMLARDVRDTAISLLAKKSWGCYLSMKYLRVKGQKLQSFNVVR